MANKKILMLCANCWTSTFQVGSHHIAHALVKNGYQVAFISDPVSPLHLLSGVSNELKDRFSIFKQGGRWNKEKTLWTYVPAALATPHNKPLLRSEWLQKNWQRLMLKDVKKKIINQGFDHVDYIYLDSINHAFLLDVISHEKSILRIADNFSGFAKATPAALEHEQQLAQRVDCVAYTAKSLQELVLQLKPKQTLFFPNGVNYSHFALTSTARPVEYSQIDKPIVLYVGAINSWFDFACVNFLAEAMPDTAFVLIGPVQKAKQRLLKRDNIYLLGSRQYQALPAYLQHADVGIIPFDRKNNAELIDHVNPLKLYEYLAAGLPVVSTRWPELENLNTPAKLADNHEEFMQKIKQALAGPKNKAELQLFAKNYQWTERVKTLLK